jgi:cell division protein FtsW
MMVAKAAVNRLDFLFAEKDRQMNAVQPDMWLFIAVVAIVAFGLVMMTSASITSAERVHDNAFYFLERQSVFLLAGVAMGWLMLKLPMKLWQAASPLLLVLSLLALMLVLVPGVGKNVNGSVRWLNLGFASVQVSEFVKLFVVIYMASYIARHSEAVQTRIRGFLMPMIVLAVTGTLLLAEPDFGTTVVISITVMGMLLLAGVQLRHFMVLAMLAITSFAILALTSPYRMQRLTAFLDPFARPFDSGYQLTQSLIAFGRGEWFGVGLGSSVQKLFYLPEAHTDFVFAVIAEELGFIGVMIVIALYLIVLWRAIVIGRLAQMGNRIFSAFVAYGIGLWLAFQAYVNVGVNMGVLPTKGITLPMMSYGGSSLIVSILAIALLFRIDKELKINPPEVRA